MAERFAAFSFVDRITELHAGTRARGYFAVPEYLVEFPSCLVAEAVGQLAAWVAMAHVEFRRRPVAALATETIFHRVLRPGQTLELGVDIETCDDDAVAYGGFARVDGVDVITLNHCLGPMLPVEEFDSPDALRERFALLCEYGAARDRFRGLDEPPVSVVASEPGRSVRATMQVPTTTSFFADHFPRRAVFPATLLLNAQMRLALQLAAGAVPEHAAMMLVPSRMTNVKMRSFILPGQTVEIAAEIAPSKDDNVTTMLSASVDGRKVATAQLEITARSAS